MLESSWFSQKLPSIQQKRLDLKELEPKEDGVEFHKRGSKKADLSQAATAQVTIKLTDLIPEEWDGDEDYEQAVRSALIESAGNILMDRRFTEFVDGKTRMQSSSESRQRSSVLVIPRSGDWGRYGLQPLRVAKQSEGETYLDLLYTTLKGGIFDGQLQFAVDQKDNGDVVIQTNVLIPKRARKVRLFAAALRRQTKTHLFFSCS